MHLFRKYGLTLTDKVDLGLETNDHRLYSLGSKKNGMP